MSGVSHRPGQNNSAPVPDFLKVWRWGVRARGLRSAKHGGHCRMLNCWVSFGRWKWGRRKIEKWSTLRRGGESG